MSTVRPTWEPHEEHSHLTMRSNLPDTVFAFPNHRKEPLTDARHVRNAVARFDQVIDVREGSSVSARNGVDLSETNGHQLGVHPQQHRKEAAAKAVETKREHGALKKAAAKAAATRRANTRNARKNATNTRHSRTG